MSGREGRMRGRKGRMIGRKGEGGWMTAREW